MERILNKKIYHITERIVFLEGYTEKIEERIRLEQPMDKDTYYFLRGEIDEKLAEIGMLSVKRSELKSINEWAK